MLKAVTFDLWQGKRVQPEDRLMDDLDEAYSLPILSALPRLNIGAREVLAQLRADGLSLALMGKFGRCTLPNLRFMWIRASRDTLATPGRVC